MWKICLCMLSVGVMLVEALPESASSGLQFIRKRETAHRYCGRHLVTVLHLLCNGNYNEEMKRSFETDGKSFQDADDGFWVQPETSDIPLEYPFRTRSSANSPMANKLFRRQTRNGGIVEECCIYKGCTRNELIEYCSDR